MCPSLFYLFLTGLTTDDFTQQWEALLHLKGLNCLHRKKYWVLVKELLVLVKELLVLVKELLVLDITAHYNYFLKKIS